MRSVTLENGTNVTIGDDWCETRLPCGSIVDAKPNDQSAGMALRLGYGGDVAAMTREHDYLHSAVCNLLELPYSYSLMQAAGRLPSKWDYLAWQEEDLILKLQAFANLVKRACLDCGPDKSEVIG